MEIWGLDPHLFLKKKEEEKAEYMNDFHTTKII
jgi:hypothetical protein